jgi:RNA polymerase sigma-70 factor (ECF subfamily)
MSPGGSLALELAAGGHATDAEMPSFEEVFRDNVPFAWRTLRRLGVREADVADVCQEVFVVVHRRLGDFDAAFAMRTWIYGICLRTASQYRRRAPQRREAGEDGLRDAAVSPEQEGLVERAWAKRRLDAALARLDDDKRAVFVLYELEELPMKEVAVAVGCPLQTAYSRLHAARRELEVAFRALSKEDVT